MCIQRHHPSTVGHIVSREGITDDLDKVKPILNAPAPKNMKTLCQFLGQIRWHSRMLRYLAEFATLLHTVD